MSGKKFISIFLVIITVSAIGLVLWIKQGYDSRPAAHVEGDTTTESCAGATVILNRFIDLDYAGKTTALSAEVDSLMDLETAKDGPGWDTLTLTRESVVAGCREVAPEQVEIVVSHTVYGALSNAYTKDEVDAVLKNEPKQMQTRVSLIRRVNVWKIERPTVYGPHVGAEAAVAQVRP